MKAAVLYAPCDDCPFLKEGGIRLRGARCAEIARAFTDDQGALFPCHKHAVLDDDDEWVNRSEAPLCAGGLVFAEKQGRANQMVRILERLGLYDVRQLKGHDRVFDSLREMQATADDERRPRAANRLAKRKGKEE